MKRALICGISGQDGGYLTRLLLSKGYAVWGTSRDAQMNEFFGLHRLGIREQVTICSMAINDFRSVLQVIDQVQPDEIYNLAGQSSVGLSFEQPMETLESIAMGCINLLECIRFLKRPIRFYNACSSECFGDTLGLPASETTPFHPQSPYAMAKAAAFWGVSNYRIAYGIFACSGILFNHESPLRPLRFVTRKIISGVERIRRGEQRGLQLGSLDVKRDWGWAPEYVDAMWRMVQREQPEDYVIATGQSHSLATFVERAFAMGGLDWREHITLDPGLARPSEIRVSVGDASKAERELGWKSTYQLEAILQKMLEAESHPDRIAGIC